jgi:hypothetical protein
MTVDWKGNIEWIFHSHNPLKKLFAANLNDSVAGITDQYARYKQEQEQEAEQQGNSMRMDTDAVYHICRQLHAYVLESEKERKEHNMAKINTEVTWLTSSSSLETSARDRVYSTLEVSQVE